jgi:hypothetical protein
MIGTDVNKDGCIVPAPFRAIFILPSRHSTLKALARGSIPNLVMLTSYQGQATPNLKSEITHVLLLLLVQGGDSAE